MTNYRDTLRFDSVVVIESLRQDDLKTGQWLFDRVFEPLPRRSPPLHTEFIQAASKPEFLAALDDVRDRLFRNGHLPIIHIEAHGQESGIELGGGETLEWENLRARLTEMNVLSKANLLVVMGVCAGWHLSRLLQPMDRAPVWGVVGPLEDVKAGDLREAMETLYRTIVGGDGGYQAVSSMNHHVAREQWKFLLETAETMFCRVFHHYAQNLTSEERLRDAENEIAAEIVRRRGGDLLAGMEARHRAHQMLLQHADMFAYYRKTFLLIDLFPENDERFRLTYDDCAGVSAPAA